MSGTPASKRKLDSFLDSLVDEASKTEITVQPVLHAEDERRIATCASLLADPPSSLIKLIEKRMAKSGDEIAITQQSRSNHVATT